MFILLPEVVFAGSGSSEPRFAPSKAPTQGELVPIPPLAIRKPEFPWYKLWKHQLILP